MVTGHSSSGKTGPANMVTPLRRKTKNIPLPPPPPLSPSSAMHTLSSAINNPPLSSSPQLPLRFPIPPSQPRRAPLPTYPPQAMHHGRRRHILIHDACGRHTAAVVNNKKKRAGDDTATPPWAAGGARHEPPNTDTATAFGAAGRVTAGTGGATGPGAAAGRSASRWGPGATKTTTGARGRESGRPGSGHRQEAGEEGTDPAAKGRHT